MHICQFCSRSFARPSSLATHSPYCKENPNRVDRQRSPNAGRKKGSVGWNKGLSGDPRCAKPERVGVRWGASLHGHTDESKAKIAAYAKEHHGGYKEGSGRGKKGRYKGQFCDSSWELAYLIYCEAHGKSVLRNTEKFPYEFNGKTKNYMPDFIVDGKYVEIKGYLSPEWEAKQKAFPHQLEILTQAEMQPIIGFVVSLHGKDFVKLYE